MATPDPTAGLPPKPDPVTGEPRPPHGPNFKGNDHHNRGSREKRDRLKPEPPPGEGPVLAWYQGSRSHAVNGFVWTFIILAVIVSIMTWTRGLGVFHWIAWWPVWTVLALGPLGVSNYFKGSRISAGAEWLRYGTSKTGWVRTYELTSIAVQHHTSTSSLHLKDSDGRAISPEFVLLWSDRLIWDLLCNGVRHSAANGATYNEGARKTFHLPDLYSPGVQASGDTTSSND